MPAEIVGREAAIASLRRLDLLDRTAAHRVARLVELAAGALDVPAAAINLVDGERQHTHASFGIQLPDLSLDESLCATAVAADEVVATADAQQDPRFAHMNVVRAGDGIGFYLGAPIHSPEGHAIGTLCVVAPERREIDDRDERLLRELASWVERELVEGDDRRRAEVVQRRLFPAPVDLPSGWQLAGECVVSEQVGGDLYDWRLHPSGRLLDVTIADVMGKGVGAALVMASIRAVLRGLPVDTFPVRCVAAASEALLEDFGDDGGFMTMVDATVDLRSGAVALADAGHGLVWHVTADGTAHRIASGGPPAGILADAEWEATRVVLEPGETLVVASDGLLDLYRDLDAATAAVGAVCTLPSATHVVRALTAPVGTARHEDDVTAVAIRRTSA